MFLCKIKMGCVFRGGGSNRENMAHKLSSHPYTEKVMTEMDAWETGMSLSNFLSFPTKMQTDPQHIPL